VIHRERSPHLEVYVFSDDQVRGLRLRIFNADRLLASLFDSLLHLGGDRHRRLHKPDCNIPPTAGKELRSQTNPQSFHAYDGRGDARRAKSDYEKAIADYSEAIRIRPQDASTYYSRAVLALIARRDGSVSGMRTVLELDARKGKLAPCAVILGHLAARIANDENAAKEILGPLAKDLDPSVWPYPAVRFLRGELDEAQFLALAIDNDKKTEARCFLGMYHDLAGRTKEALAHLSMGQGARYQVVRRVRDRRRRTEVARSDE
jgi:tetratricopeptide (TPR) repeat protein